MTTQERAKEIVKSYHTWVSIDGKSLSIGDAKKLALITIDLILGTRPGYPYAHEVGVEIKGLCANMSYPVTYWTKVKQEIEGL